MKLFGVNYKKLTDQELVNRYKETNDNKVLGELFERYHVLVYGCCIKYLKNEATAKDISMQIFELLFEKLLKHEVKYFKSWLYTLSRNECLMYLRKNKSASNNNEAVLENLESVDELEDKIQLEWRLESLENAIEGLPEEQSKCIIEFFINKRSYNDISRMLKMDIKKVKSNIQNGKRNLKISLEQHELKR